MTIRIIENQFAPIPLLLLADPEPTPWTRRVSRHCDELLLLADAQGRLFVTWKDRRDGNNEIYFRAGEVSAPVSDAGGPPTGNPALP